jgi:DNA-binding PadR family transcriptional regulator
MISVSRLLVLGMLNRGPMHGHQIRREAEIRDVQNWAGIKPGGLYGTLNRLAEEGLVEPVSTERAGKMPARTVYAITGEGRKELAILLESALEHKELALDAFDVALLVVDALPKTHVAELMARRAESVALAHKNMIADRLRLRNLGHTNEAEDALMRHAELRLEAEIKWHQEVAGLFDAGAVKLNRSR